MNRKKKGKRRQTREKNRRLKKKKNISMVLLGTQKKPETGTCLIFHVIQKLIKKKLNIHDECPKKKKKEKLSFD